MSRYGMDEDPYDPEKTGYDPGYDNPGTSITTPDYTPPSPGEPGGPDYSTYPGTGYPDYSHDWSGPNPGPVSTPSSGYTGGPTLPRSSDSGPAFGGGPATAGDAAKSAMDKAYQTVLDQQAGKFPSIITPDINYLQAVVGSGWDPATLARVAQQTKGSGITIQNQGTSDPLRPRFTVPGDSPGWVWDFGPGGWVHRYVSGDAKSSSGGPGGPGGSPGPGSGGPGGNYPTGGGPLNDALMKLIQRGQTPVDPNDPLISGATGAYRSQADRSVRKARAAMAERAAASGLNSGGAGSGYFNSGIDSMLEREGQDVGSYQSGLMLNEDRLRRAELLSALGLGIPMQEFYDNMAYSAGKDQNSSDMQLLMLMQMLNR